MMNRQGSHEKYVRATVRIANEALNACYQRIAELEAENASMKAQSDAFVAGWLASDAGKTLDQCPVEPESPEGQWWAKGWQWREDSLENERLRELLPKPEVRRAIRLHANGLLPKNGKHWNAEILAWLERLEAESEEP